ncbi:MAG: hypothetical protein ABR992_14530 [Solirubrobacteraceae bacterium]|jgi:hypothetical protein
MAFLVALLTLALIAGVVLIVGAPLRRAGRLGQPQPGSTPTLASDDAPGSATSASQMEDLDAAREAKYREIRDAELDFRTGKLSREDYDAIDADLRAEALDILNRLESSDQPSGVAPSTGAEGG